MSTPPGPPHDPDDPRYSQQPPGDYSGIPSQAYPEAAGYPGTGYGPVEPPAGDPLVPADLSGWFERIVGVFKRSFVPLLQIQIAVAAVGILYGLLVGNDLAELAGRAQLAPESVDPAAVLALLGSSLLGALVLIVVSSFAAAASVFLAVRDANGEPSSLGDALRFAVGRALPLIGWQLLAGLMLVVGTLLLVLPGVYIAIVISASLVGVVVVERAGLSRCFTLVNARFLPTTGRVLLAVLIGIAFTFLVSFIASAFGPASVLGTIIQSVLTIPLAIAGVGFTVVTYAELRYREHPGVLTPTLAAELRR